MILTGTLQNFPACMSCKTICPTITDDRMLVAELRGEFIRVRITLIHHKSGRENLLVIRDGEAILLQLSNREE